MELGGGFALFAAFGSRGEVRLADGFGELEGDRNFSGGEAGAVEVEAAGGEEGG